MCDKKSFDSEREALKFGRRRVPASCRHRAYLCDHCSAWHLTTQKKTEESRGGKEPYRRERFKMRDYC